MVMLNNQRVNTLRQTISSPMASTALNTRSLVMSCGCGWLLLRIEPWSCSPKWLSSSWRKIVIWCNLSRKLGGSPHLVSGYSNHGYNHLHMDRFVNQLLYNWGWSSKWGFHPVFVVRTFFSAHPALSTGLNRNWALNLSRHQSLLICLNQSGNPHQTWISCWIEKCQRNTRKILQLVVSLALPAHGSC